jgi:serine phosphatase RsbU (regulator of sigma subunit)
VVTFDPEHRAREADYFRLGVADIVETDFQQPDIELMIDRLRALAEKRQRIQEHQQQLEKTNNELQKTLRNLQQDQKAGREVQKSLMPEGPLRFNDFEISHAAAPSLYLSGDFVSYNLALDRYILFYFADVSGHGASSAFVTVLLRFMIGRVIRRHILEEDYAALAQAPEGLVESINQQILDTGLDKHLTIVAGSLDTQTRQLRYVVGAQQPSPILIHEGEAKFLPW